MSLHAILNYCLWFKGGSSRKGPDQALVKLEATTLTCDPKVLVEAMRSHNGVEDLVTRTCEIGGSELFGSTKMKLNLPPRSKYNSHHLVKVRYSIPHPTLRSTKACFEESFKHDENVISHTTNIFELRCQESQHLAHFLMALPVKGRMSSIACQHMACMQGQSWEK